MIVADQGLRIDDRSAENASRHPRQSGPSVELAMNSLNGIAERGNAEVRVGLNSGSR